MGGDAETDASFTEALAHAAHHRGAMVERRTIGLKIVIGVVSFDLVVMKLAVDATSHVTHHGQLAWSVRLMATGAFIVLAGMLLQLESRNRLDRGLYRTAELRAKALQDGLEKSAVSPHEETLGEAVRSSWATTWPLAGVFVLTVAMWWIAGLLT